jgi:hypothetical protein
VTIDDVISKEEAKQHPEEAKQAVELAENGLPVRPSSLTYSELLETDVQLIASNPLAKYQIEKSLGEGAYANVLLVVDNETSE